jgi:hypothetical protein
MAELGAAARAAGIAALRHAAMARIMGRSACLTHDRQQQHHGAEKRGCFNQRMSHPIYLG